MDMVFFSELYRADSESVNHILSMPGSFSLKVFIATSTFGCSFFPFFLNGFNPPPKSPVGMAIPAINTSETADI